MSFLNGGTPEFHYLTDGDGFPTNIKYDYWTRGLSFASEYQKDAYLRNLGIRTVEQETVNSGEYRSMGIADYGIGWNNTGQNPLYWNNARTGAVARGKMNYIPLRPKEAIQVYWLFRGVKFSLNRLGLSTSSKGAKASIQVPQTFDGGYFFNRAGYRPYEKIWKASQAGGEQFSARDDGDATWKELDNGTKLNASADVSYHATSYVTFNQLIRFPKAGAEADYGFERVFDFGATMFTAVDDRGLAWYDLGYGSGGNDGTTLNYQLGSAFYFPEDEKPNFSNSDQIKYSLEKVDFEGVPMLAWKSQSKGGTGGVAGQHDFLDGDVYDVIYERVN